MRMYGNADTYADMYGNFVCFFFARATLQTGSPALVELACQVPALPMRVQSNQILPVGILIG